MNISEKFDVDLIKKNLLPYEGSPSTFLNSYLNAFEARNTKFVLESIHQFLEKGKVEIESPVDGLESLAVASIGNLGSTHIPQYILMKSGLNYWVVVQSWNFIDYIILPDKVLYFNPTHINERMLNVFPRVLECFDKIDNFNSDLKGFFISHNRPYHFFYDQLLPATYIESTYTDLISDRYNFIFKETFVDPNTFLKNSHKHPENNLFEVYLRPCLVELSKKKSKNDLDRSMADIMENRLRSAPSKENVNFDEYDFVLWIGITGQKRIWVEQVEGYASIIKNLSKEFSNILVVVDGWTASYGEQKVLPEEEQILNKIKKSSKGTASFVSVIGKDYYHKISICNNVDYFIANAGSGCFVPLRVSRKDGVLHRNNGPITFPDKYKLRSQRVEFIKKDHIKHIDLEVKGAHMMSYHTNWKIIYNLLINMINEEDNKNIAELKITEKEELGSDILVSLQEWKQVLSNKEKIASEGVFVDMLRDLALRFESHGDLDTAFALMVEAKKLRPEGPFIEQKTLEYYNKLNGTE